MSDQVTILIGHTCTLYHKIGLPLIGQRLGIWKKLEQASWLKRKNPGVQHQKSAQLMSLTQEVVT